MPWAGVTAVVVLAGAVLLTLLWIGGGLGAALPGIDDAGALTRWGLPVARVALDVAGVLTVGFALVAVLLPTRGGGDLTGTAVRSLHAAARSAVAWAAAALATFLLTASDLAGLPLLPTLSPGVMGSVLTLPQATALLAVLAGAALLACSAPFVLTRNGAVLLLLAALLVLLPPALTGHAAGAADHDLATTSLGVHLVAGALWVGGLLALVLLRMRRTEQLVVSVGRFSAMATWCVVAIALSGVLSATVRLSGPADLLTSAYGRIVLLKLAALLVLAGTGWWHRTRTLPQLRGERASAAFRRLALVEAGVMVVTVAVAVALSRTPPLVSDTIAVTDPAEALLGYPMPPPPTLASLVTQASPDLFFLVLAGILGLAYARGVLALGRRGDRWPPGRSLAWAGGLLVLTLSTSSGLAPYGSVLFSGHMAQHMLLAMVVPLCLVLGAPVTLALRVLPARGPDGDAGVREVVLAAVHSRPARVVAHPLVALAIFVVSLYGTYYTGLFELGMRSHVGHVLMHLHFIAVGYVFYSMLIGSDPAPSRPPYLFRIVVLFVGMVLHAFFGIAVMESGTLLGAGWWDDLARPWGPTPLEDQRLAGSVAWSFGELPTLGVLAALFVQWVRADEREARRGDRAAERSVGTEDDELAAYNRYLAALDRPAGSRPEPR